MPVPAPAITFSFSACTVLEFMPDGELMRDRFVVITRRRRRNGKSRKTSGLASLSPRERATATVAAVVSERDGGNKEPKMGRGTTIRVGSEEKGAGARPAKGMAGGDAERERDGQREGGGGARRSRRASEAWPGKAVRHSGSDGGGSEPITYYNCLASERNERGAPVRHPSSRRIAPLPITSAVIANFSRPCLPPLPSPSLNPRCRDYPLHAVVSIACLY